MVVNVMVVGATIDLLGAKYHAFHVHGICILDGMEVGLLRLASRSPKMHGLISQDARLMQKGGSTRG